MTERKGPRPLLVFLKIATMALVVGAACATGWFTAERLLR
jgi:hypothetical protein